MVPVFIIDQFKVSAKAAVGASANASIMTTRAPQLRPLIIIILFAISVSCPDGYAEQ